MSYQLLPNILFIGSILGILLIILRHLPEAVGEQQNSQGEITKKLSLKGLPVVDFSKFRAYLKWLGQKLWNFILEAKDLRPTAAVGYRVKKIFGRSAISASPAATKSTPTVDTQADGEPDKEKVYLEKIKAEPKNLALYNELGKFYLDNDQAADARDIYQYLVKHNMTNAEFYARLATSDYKLKDYGAAVGNYAKSLEIDPAQPNRLYNKAICEEALGLVKESTNTFKQAIALEPHNLKFYLSLAQTFLKLGDRLEAKNTLEKAKKIDPQNTEIAEKIKTM